MKLRSGAFLVLAAILLGPAASADTFGGTSGSLPNVTNLEIYEVTGLSESEKRSSGTLIGEGLNRTFSLSFEEYSVYRFEFSVKNEGQENWTIEGADELSHSGLNSSWQLEEAFYNISDPRYGGNFTSGTVKWNTSNGGILETSGPNSTMDASYIVNITGVSRDYGLEFTVNDTSDQSGSTDLHEVLVTNFGELNISVLRPPNETLVQSNKSFNLTGEVECLDGLCGEVDLSGRYNASGQSAGTLIPQDTGAPFHTLGGNTKLCDVYLERSQSCRTNISVNSTGQLGTSHLIDVNASSNLTGVQENDSEDRQVTIRSIILMDLSWDTTRFGAADPGSEDVPAKGNDNLRYNVSITEESNRADNLFARATPLTSKIDPDYSIAPGNITLSLDQNPSEDDTRLSTGFKEIDTGTELLPGTIIETFYYLDVPTGLTAGDYNGTLVFKANSS